MRELVLMTAAFRLNNLVQSYESIEKCFKSVSGVHITWLICRDQYNAYGDLDNVIRLCKKGCTEFGMGWLIYNAGKKGQPNYGGDMYNEALKWLKNNWFKDTDPWVYVFDDDNIIHPAMAQNFAHISSVAQEENKTIIWLCKSQGCGTIDVSYEKVAFSFHTFKDGRRECLVGLPDPSQIIMKYSEIENMGFYRSEFDYDKYLWGYLDEKFSKILFSSDWLNMADKNYIPTQFQAYHNGQIREDEIEKIEKTKGNNSYCLVCEGNSLNDIIAHRFAIPSSIGEDCFNKMKTYAIEKGYVTDKRIFKNIDKIYVLTQVDTPERWDFVIEQFKKLGVYDELYNKIEVVKGVKIPGLNEHVIETIAMEGLGNPIYNAEMTYSVPFFNCTNEHYRILNQAIAENYENIMIVEDDACFIKNIEALKRALDTMPDGFDILHLEGFISRTNEDEIVKRVTESLDKTVSEGKWKPYEDFRTWASACIIYSKNGMRRYVQEQREYIVGVDNRLGTFVDNCYMYSFPLVRQEDRSQLISGIESRIIPDTTNLYLLYSNKQDYFSMFET